MPPTRDPGATEAARFAPRVYFLKEEIFDLCVTLARAADLLAQAGRPGAAAELSAAFNEVEGRLVLLQALEPAEDSASSALS